MKLEDQVTSLELARRLKKLGVKQESAVWWGGIGGNFGLWCDHVKNDLPEEEKRFVWFSAFTVAELGEMLGGEYLPEYKSNWNIDGRHKDIDDGKNWFVEDFGIYEVTEANARAKMMIYLLEIKLI